MFAKVIVDISHERLDRTFEYIIPPALEEKIIPGTRVAIPFGQGNRQITGYVTEVSNQAEFDVARLKEIIGVPAGSLPIESALIQLAAYMKRTFGGTMNQALKTVIPIKKKEAEKLKKIVSLSCSTDDAKNVLADMLGRKNHSLAKERLLRELIEQGSLEWDTITGKLEVSSANIRDMEKSGIVKVESIRTFRNPVAATDRRGAVTLNEQQQNAVNTIIDQSKSGENKTFLIHGVTGSGKTEVYMKVLETVIAEGKQAIILIPEIALTYQTLMRFYNRFGDMVSVLNSRMTPGERFDQFERAKNGDIRIMVGPRSALFTPFDNLGVIIIDEEHETSYKSEVIPRYNAVDVAIERARIQNAFVVLGSATPSVSSYMRASSGEFKLIELDTRVAGRELPQCHIVDLRKELASGNRSMLSVKLQELMTDRLEKNQQIMLFLNRRGMMGFISCRECGEVIKCPHCDVSLSLHRDGMLHCHYCGYKVPKPPVCPKCNSKYIGTFKAGTEKLEEIVQKAYPNARILRMDSDTTSGKNGHEDILSAFSNHEADILIGTQMIVKGHDFSAVTLVGVIAADMSINDNSYVSGERTFQLLTQAVGRAGRGELPGEAVIQTYNPEHYAITSSSQQDYKGFYEHEISYRRMLGYPPTGHMLLITTVGKSYDEVVERCAQICDRIGKRREIMVLGPSDAALAKVKDEYHRNIYIKSLLYEELIFVKDEVEKYLLEPGNFKTTTWFDFDPVGGF